MPLIESGGGGGATYTTCGGSSGKRIAALEQAHTLKALNLNINTAYQGNQWDFQKAALVVGE
jgi:hypothetical protein